MGTTIHNAFIAMSVASVTDASMSAAEAERARLLGNTAIVGPGLLGRALQRQIDAAGGVSHLLGRASRPSLAPALPEGTETLIVCVHPRDHHASKQTQALLEDTVAVTAALMVEAAGRGVQRCAVVSSGAVYAAAERPHREDDRLVGDDASPYALAKLRAEQVAAMWRGHFKSLLIYRPYFLYGAESSRIQLLPSLTRRMRLGEPISLQGERGLRLSPTYIDDAVRAIVWTLAEDRELDYFNIAGPEVLDLAQICGLISRTLDLPVKYQYKNEGSPIIAGSLDRLKSTGFLPRVCFPDGLGRSVSSWTM
jgi:nucleoside-diphosphate-sugar epimerase